MSMVVIPYPGNEQLAQRLCADLRTELLSLELRHFPDDEVYLRVAGTVGARTVIVACGLDRPNDKSIGLFLLASTLRDLGARKVVLVAPYLPYLRQDKAFQAGESVSARYFARFLSSAFDGLMTVDPHLHRIQNLSEVYSIPTQVVHAAPAISAWIAANLKSPLLIGPDSESEQWVREIAQGVGCPFVVLEKRRHGDRDVAIALPNIGRLRDRTAVLVDDIISTGSTMLATVRHLRNAKAQAPVCIAVHAIFAGDAYAQLSAAGAARIVSCNTITHASNGIDVNRLLVQAIAEMR